MTETIEYEHFEQAAEGGGGGAPEIDLSRLSDVPTELTVEIGRTHMTVGETLDLHVGSVVTVERLAGESADLVVNGSPIARGEVVVIDEQYGLRITEILDGQADTEAVTPAAQPAARTGGEAVGEQPSVPSEDAVEDPADAGEG